MRGGWLPDGRWKGFAQDPKDSSVREGTVFGPLESVINAIIQAARMADSNSETPRTRCKCSGDKVPLGARIDSSRPDGWLRLESSKVPNTSSQSDDHWEDICCPFEFKKRSRNEDCHDVRSSHLTLYAFFLIDCMFIFRTDSRSSGVVIISWQTILVVDSLSG
jgi:hypothetical protein